MKKTILVITAMIAMIQFIGCKEDPSTSSFAQDNQTIIVGKDSLSIDHVLKELENDSVGFVEKYSNPELAKAIKGSIKKTFVHYEIPPNVKTDFVASHINNVKPALTYVSNGVIVNTEIRISLNSLYNYLKNTSNDYEYFMIHFVEPSASILSINTSKYAYLTNNNHVNNIYFFYSLMDVNKNPISFDEKRDLNTYASSIIDVNDIFDACVTNFINHPNSTSPYQYNYYHVLKNQKTPPTNTKAIMVDRALLRTQVNHLKAIDDLTPGVGESYYKLHFAQVIENHTGLAGNELYRPILYGTDKQFTVIWEPYIKGTSRNEFFDLNNLCPPKCATGFPY